MFVMPTHGVWTSGLRLPLGRAARRHRHRQLHRHSDRAAADGVVIDVGPTAGYGAWVKLRHADGTVTLYGHVNTWLVSIGERVMAGDQIATMGNRGNSTGPHLHFEVLLNGTDRVDPVPWLAKRDCRPAATLADVASPMTRRRLGITRFARAASSEDDTHRHHPSRSD